MKIYDSMRVRDDLRETGDNVFWVREADAIRLVKDRDHLIEKARGQRDNNLARAKRVEQQAGRLWEALQLVDRHIDRFPDSWGESDAATIRAALKETSNE